MEKNLTVYPIASGDVLNVFASNKFNKLKILDMSGNVVHTELNISHEEIQLDIRDLTEATYIIEIAYDDEKTARSVFVKTS